MKYIDAIVHFCEQNSIDIESVPKLISKPKEKIKYEAWTTFEKLQSKTTTIMMPFDAYKCYCL